VHDDTPSEPSGNNISSSSLTGTPPVSSGYQSTDEGYLAKPSLTLRQMHEQGRLNHHDTYLGRRAGR
jgi:hypothetical protein